MLDKDGGSGGSVGMAKRRKTKTLVWDDEIEQLWATVREHSRRMDAIELEALSARFGVSGLSDEALDRLIKEALQEKPWYVKAGHWVRNGDTSWVALGLSIVALVASVVAVFSQ